MRKIKYERPEMKVTMFESEDIITTSGLIDAGLGIGGDGGQIGAALREELGIPEE